MRVACVFVHFIIAECVHVCAVCFLEVHGSPLHGAGPPGTEAAPGLDATNLVVGRVVAGLDLVERLAKLPSVADNHGSPFFILAKAVGDKRAPSGHPDSGRK